MASKQIKPGNAHDQIRIKSRKQLVVGEHITSQSMVEALKTACDMAFSTNRYPPIYTVLVSDRRKRTWFSEGGDNRA